MNGIMAQGCDCSGCLEKNSLFLEKCRCPGCVTFNFPKVGIKFIGMVINHFEVCQNNPYFKKLNNL